MLIIVLVCRSGKFPRCFRIGSVIILKPKITLQVKSLSRVCLFQWASTESELRSYRVIPQVWISRVADLTALSVVPSPERLGKVSAIISRNFDLESSPSEVLGSHRFPVNVIIG